MKKSFMMSVLVNLLVFGTAALLMRQMSLVLFSGMIYLVPLGINPVIYQKAGRKPFLLGLLPVVTTVGYCLFSYLFMQQGTVFQQFVSGNSQMLGDLAIQIQGNLLGIGQILFVFLINFGAIYLSNLMVKGNQHVTSQRA